MSAKALLLEGGRWRIGNGESIKLWGDKWLVNSPYGGVVGPASFDHQWVKVSALIEDVPMCWNMTNLQELLNEGEINMITKVRLPSIQCNDRFCWPRENLGEYSVRSGYRLLRERFETSQEKKALWGKVWKCNIPPKIKVFAWRLIHGILPLRQSLAQRQILPSAQCLTCGEGMEDNDHCFVDCVWVRKVWESGNLSSVPPSVHGDECFRSWIEHMALHGTSVDLGKYLTTAWSIWKSRNTCIFQNKVVLPTSVISQAVKMLQQFNQAAAARSDHLPHAPPQQKWKPPIGEVIKINCDGAFLADGRAGFGAVCRAADGAVLGAFCGPGEVCQTVMEAEVIAIKEGMLFARDCGFRNVMVESDASNVIKEILHNQHSGSMHGNFVQEVRNLQNTFEVCSFHYVPRHCNAVADRLASIGVREPQPLYWLEEIPDCISDVILSDI